jgi:hypothetical protein
MSNLDVKRTAKLFIGGAFPRSESGRTYEIFDKNKKFVANVALASRKDAHLQNGQKLLPITVPKLCIAYQK